MSGAGQRESRADAACVGRLSDRTTRSSAPLHAERRAEGALPLPVGARKKSVTVENLRAPLFLRTHELQSRRLRAALTPVV